MGRERTGAAVVESKSSKRAVRGIYACDSLGANTLRIERLGLVKAGSVVDILIFSAIVIGAFIIVDIELRRIFSTLDFTRSKNAEKNNLDLASSFAFGHVGVRVRVRHVVVLYDGLGRGTVVFAITQDGVTVVAGLVLVILIVTVLSLDFSLSLLALAHLFKLLSALVDQGSFGFLVGTREIQSVEPTLQANLAEKKVALGQTTSLAVRDADPS